MERLKFLRLLPTFVAAAVGVAGCMDGPVECEGGGEWVKGKGCACPADKPLNVNDQCTAWPSADGGVLDGGAADAASGNGGRADAAWQLDAAPDAAPHDAATAQDSSLDATLSVANDGSADSAAAADANALEASAEAAALGPEACVASVEVCDGQDNDCDSQIDEGIKKRCWTDVDGDGYATNVAAVTESCACGSMQTAQEPTMGKVDCDDSAVAKNPTAMEVCDGQDNNCDGQTDEPFPVQRVTVGPKLYETRCVPPECNGVSEITSPRNAGPCLNALAAQGAREL